jgi:hypothetical protein
LDRLIDKGIVVHFGYITTNGKSIPSSIASVETFLKFSESIGLNCVVAYQESNNIAAAAVESSSIGTLSLLSGTPIEFSAAQRAYLNKYLQYITPSVGGSSDSDAVDRILDKGLITNIGYKNNQDISITIPGFVLSSIETYLKFNEAIGYTNNYTFWL